MNGQDVILRYSEGSGREGEGLPAQAGSFGVPQDDAARDRARRAGRGRRWLANLAIALYFAGLTFALFGDLLTTSRAVVSAPDMDVDQQYRYWRAFAFGELRAGRLPLWNPYPFGGVPALGNFQNAVLYPPNVLHLVLPHGRAINWMFASHVWLAGVLAAAWCRSRGSGAVASAVGGTVYALGAPFILHVYAGHLNYLTTMAWTPLLFVAVDRILADRQAAAWGWVVGVLAVAMQVLTGCPQPAYYAALAVIGYAALRLVRSPMRVWFRAGGAIAAMFIAGALLSAGQLVPAWDAGRESVRAGALDYAMAASYSLPPENLLTLLAPFPLGDDFAAPYAGRWLVWEVSLFVGPAALVLAALAAARSKRRADRAVLFAALIALVLALGWHTPLFKLLYHALPGWDRFRAPVRFNIIFSLMLAALAARGFDLLLLRRPVTPRVAAAVLIAAGLTAGIGIIVRARPEAWAAVLSDTSHVARSAAHASSQFLRAALLLAQVGVVLLLLRRARWVAYALAVVLVADLYTSGGRAIERFQPRDDAPAEWREALASLGPDDRVLTVATARSNIAAHLGVEDAWGYDPSMPSRWAGLVGHLLGADPRQGDFVVRRLEGSPAWSMLRVRHALPPGPPFDQPLPRVLLIDDARVVDGAAASLAAVLEPSFDPRRQVVLEETPSPSPVKGATGSARVTRREAGRLQITADVDRPAILLITDAYSAGWRAAGYTVLPANHVLRAIPLPAGKHSIVLEYAPPSVGVGLWISSLSCLAFVALLPVLIRRRPAARLVGRRGGP